MTGSVSFDVQTGEETCDKHHRSALLGPDLSLIGGVVCKSIRFCETEPVVCGVS